VNLDWVIPCRYVEVHNNLGTIVGAGVDTFWVRELPATVQVVLAIRLLAMADEIGEDVKHSATNRVRNPNGDLVSEVGGEFTVAGENAHQDWLTGIMVTGVVQLEVTEAGTYTLEAEVDGSTESLPIHIVHGPPPGVDWPEAEE
jgi:Family of unknown function (DUF6941)